jgi:sec-independent protein translocase protein TatA
MFGGIGVQELLLIFLVVLLLFGAKRIPDIAHGLGKGMREFRRAMQDTRDELTRPLDEEPKDKPRDASGNKPPTTP